MVGVWVAAERHFAQVVVERRSRRIEAPPYGDFAGVRRRRGRRGAAFSSNRLMQGYRSIADQPRKVPVHRSRPVGGDVATNRLMFIGLDPYLDVRVGRSERL